MYEEEAIKAMKDFLGTTLSTPYTPDLSSYEKIMLCGNKEEGNNPMFIDTYDCVAQSAPTAKKQKVEAGAMAISVTAAAPELPEIGQRTYLEQRAYNIFRKLDDDLEEQFFIHEPSGPKTAKELAKRLKEGKYTVKIPKDVDEEEDEVIEFGGFYWRDAFSWRTPDTKADRAGYKTANEALKKFYQDVLDIIRVSSPADGFAALNDLKAWKYEVKHSKK